MLLFYFTFYIPILLLIYYGMENIFCEKSKVVALITNEEINRNFTFIISQFVKN